MILNAKEYWDKVYGCMLGKNIGGTLGGPLEGQTGPFDLTFYTTPKGAPLPNDDLDLQLVWLKCLEERGPFVDAQVLAEYWLSYIWPDWNEYGIGKANMRLGFSPPVSGDVNNPRWRHSNGAWIRSEIWACLAPGCPDLAARLSYHDTIVDHGTGEGVYAELFTASLEAAAFVESDVMKIIEVGLSMVPAKSYLARCVRKVVSLYKSGKDWLAARQAALDISKPLKVFAAPQNVAFVVIGLLWGEGDFGKTVCMAVNCGDDTDCTGATAGAIMGILMGKEGIPKKWKEYIGNSIKTIAIANFRWPSTLDELTERIAKMAPRVLGAHDADTHIVECHSTQRCGLDMKRLKDNSTVRPLWRKPAYVISRDFIAYKVDVAYQGEAMVEPKGKQKVTVEVTKTMPGPLTLDVSWRVPKGWKIAPAGGTLKFSGRLGRKRGGPKEEKGPVKKTFTITAGASVGRDCRCLLELVPRERLTAGLIQVPLLVQKKQK